MPDLKKSLSKALYYEETDLIDFLIALIKKFNKIYMDKPVKDKIIKHLNRLLDDTIRHSTMISKELMELIELGA